MKKGSFEWSTVAKLILTLIIIIVILLVIGLFKGGMDKAIENIANFFGA